jgi:hypothetical protein
MPRAARREGRDGIIPATRPPASEIIGLGQSTQCIDRCFAGFDKAGGAGCCQLGVERFDRSSS